MKITLSAFKTAAGSIGGLAPSLQSLAAVQAKVQCARWQCGECAALILDSHVEHTGDSVAILMTHTHGKSSSVASDLAEEAFREGRQIANEQGLTAGSKDEAATAAMEFAERDHESLLVFSASDAARDVFNFPLFLAFTRSRGAAPDNLKHGPEGFRFVLRDLHETGNTGIELTTPEETSDLESLLGDRGRYAIESVRVRATGETAAVLAFGAGGDPLLIVRLHAPFPEPGEWMASFAGTPSVPMMPVPASTTRCLFHDVASVTCSAFSLQNGRLTEPVDCFSHPFWNTVRDLAAKRVIADAAPGFEASLNRLPRIAMEESICSRA